MDRGPPREEPLSLRISAQTARAYKESNGSSLGHEGHSQMWWPQGPPS